MDLFLNELSLQTATDRALVHNWFTTLGKLYQAASSKGFRGIKVPVLFFGHPFAEEYTFFQWADDKEVDPDLRVLLKSVITITPSIEDLLLEVEKKHGKVFECYYENAVSVGLGAASEHVFDSISISLASSEHWDNYFISVLLSLLTEEDESEVSCDVRHASHFGNLEKHFSWLLTRNRTFISSGSILWLKKSNLFPNLIFCEHIKSQLAVYRGVDPSFVQIQKRLFELEEYASSRTSGSFDPTALPSKVTPESETRKREFVNVLTRLCPDGRMRSFDWHSRYTPGAGRIHFYPIENGSKIIIGNIANQNEIK